ncbi:MAG: transcriptional repressor [Lachnospiraceae bacterium]|nr:transcriptional repressor [Lachnospiraceae bacterium]
MEEKRTYPQGIKWTRQRKDVYDVLESASEPLSAVQIYNHIEKHPAEGNYAISTIYRILTTFEEQGMITKTTWLGDDSCVYELKRNSHTHYAVCLSCHKRIPLHDCPFEHMHDQSHEEEELQAGGFTVTGHKLELYGYCSTCNFHKA